MLGAEDHIQCKCGVVGIYAPGEDVSRLAYFALLALQHRGEESAGIAVSDGADIVVYREMGLVAQVFRDEATLSSLTGDLAIGHVRYSTTGSSHWDNAQPIHRDSGKLQVALGHNGNLVNTMDLAKNLDLNRARPARQTSTDSELIAEMIARSEKESVEEAILETLPKLVGAFTLVMADEQTVFGARDPLGLRPLALGRLPAGGHVVASETCALDAVGATFIREVEPGEMVAIDRNGLRSFSYAEATPKLCIFEFVYLARADSNLYGKSVQQTRYQMGMRLAVEAPAEADLVMPVPDAARGAAAGYAHTSGIPYGDGFVKNSYVGRTFIQPSQELREQRVGAKLNPIAHVIEGKRLVVVDDSIVRGTTTRRMVKMLRKAGAREVHMRISSPPFRWPCFYGIDTGNRDELIASSMSVDEIRDHVGADSLAYLSLDGMIDATEVDARKFCHACFSSEYPTPIPDEVKITKNMLEQTI